jgi:DNA-directed RNA polymerase specialized sigma subunit
MNQVSSIRLMKYMCQLRVEYEAQVAKNMPDAPMMEQETYELALRVRALVAGLPEIERRIVELRFDGQKTAKEISDTLDLNGPRKVYAIVERVVRRLRESIENTDMKNRVAEK